MPHPKSKSPAHAQGRTLKSTRGPHECPRACCYTVLHSTALHGTRPTSAFKGVGHHATAGGKGADKSCQKHAAAGAQAQLCAKLC